MGVEMLAEKVRRCAELMGEPFPPELLLRLKHMIVSHHGTYEFGSPKLPMTLEAMALHLLDNLDAKIHAYTREIRDDPSRESSWTPFQQSLGRRLFKGSVRRPAAGRQRRGSLSPVGPAIDPPRGPLPCPGSGSRWRACWGSSR